MNSILDVQDLKVHFPVKKGLLGRTAGYVHAVDGVSFQLNAGETLGIVGESGCGKTTTGMSLLNLEKPTEGRVLFENKPLDVMTRPQMRAVRKQMQIIFQDPYASLNPRMPIRHILGGPMKIHG